jgi:hypothetical protein
MILGRQSKCRRGCHGKLQRIITQIVLPQPTSLGEAPLAFRGPLGDRACVRALRTRGVPSMLTALDTRLETCNGRSFVGFLLVVVVVMMRVDEVGLVEFEKLAARTAPTTSSWIRIKEQGKVTCGPN